MCCLRWSLFFVVLSLDSLCWGQVQHEVVRRVSVFPMTAPAEYLDAADKAWWAVREELTSKARFLVASTQFLKQKDVYQARSELSPADAITLGSVLDANALVTLILQDRKMTMFVYDGEYGRTLWRMTASLNPAVPVPDQLTSVAQKLTQDFIASIPYQGFVITDPIIGKPVYKERKKTLVKVDVGLNSQVNVGDPVQLVRVETVNLQPLFLDGGRVEVFAEGHVVQVDRKSVVVEIERSSKDNIEELAAVRFPKELARLQEQLHLKDRLKTVNSNVLATEMNPTQERVREYKPLVLAVTFIANLAAFLLLAF